MVNYDAASRSLLPLFVDLYELTMAQVYFDEDMHETAVFSLFVRDLPENRNYLLACGLESVLDHLDGLQFDEEHLQYLNSLDKFSDDFLSMLADLRFSGNVYAVPEGTPVFANEPILEVEGPILQAQLCETLLLNQVHVQTLAASKASRVVAAAAGRSVVDFGARRTHGLDAAIKAARSFFIAGIEATSNVAAGYEYGIPVSGTMAHSFIQARLDEMKAFKAFVRRYPSTVLLVDTYDTLNGVRRVTELSAELGDDFHVTAIRLDSGDLGELAFQSRRILDEAGLTDVGIFASGGLDEYEIRRLVKTGAPIDGFGVGTNLAVSKDEPSLEVVYKLTAHAGEGRLKLSTGKLTLPGRKQIYRQGSGGKVTHDVLAKADEDHPGEPLISQVMKNGVRLKHGPSVDEIREHASRCLARLPDAVRSIEALEQPFRVELSEGLKRLRDDVIEEITEEQKNSGNR